MKKTILMSAVAAALGLSAAANAAVLHITSAVTSMTDANATTNASSSASAINNALHGTVAKDFKITYYIQVTGLTGSEQGFGNMLADVTLGSSTARSTANAHKNYAASGATANNYGSAASVFSINGDQGTSTTDLQAITVSLPGSLDPADGSADDGVRQFQLAAISDAPVAIGSIWVTYNGTSQNAPVNFVASQWSVSMGSPTVLTNVFGVGIDNQSVQMIGLVPEPASLGLLGLGVLGLAARRRQA